MTETSVFGLPVNPGLSGDRVAGKSQHNADIQNHWEESQSAGARLLNLQGVQMIKCDKIFNFGWPKLGEIHSIRMTCKFLSPAWLTRISLDSMYLSENNESNLFWLYHSPLMWQSMVGIRLYKHRVLLHNLYNDGDYHIGNSWGKESNWQRMGRSGSK